MPKLFPLGQVMCTSSLFESVPKEEIYAAITRHHHGDWGELCEEDRELNQKALAEGERLLSAYFSTEKRKKFYVITEWDRSVTTALLAEEY